MSSSMMYSVLSIYQDQVSPDNPDVQRLEMIKPFNEIFSEEFFQRPYALSLTVKLLRCVAHLHVAAIDMWLENVETGRRSVMEVPHMVLIQSQTKIS